MHKLHDTIDTINVISNGNDVLTCIYNITFPMLFYTEKLWDKLEIVKAIISIGTEF